MNTDMVKYTMVVALVAVLGASYSAWGADDPSIKGELRSNIKASMNAFIQANTVDDTFYMYDAVAAKMLLLKFKELHEGIVKKGEFYVSCADFTDGDGRMVDLDFLVIPQEKRMVTTQAAVHAVHGVKRKYHLE